MMKCTLFNFSMRYNALFQRPFFRVQDAKTTVIETLYHALSGYGVQVKDIVTTGGENLSDQKIRIDLFNRQATIEVTADRFLATFTNARYRDFLLIEECLAKALAAIERFAADSRLGVEEVFLNPILKMESVAHRAAFLQSLPQPTGQPNVGFNDTVRVFHGHILEIEHSKQEWSLSLTVQRLLGVQSDNLAINIRANFANGASSSSIREKAEIVQIGFRGFLNTHHLELTQEDHGS